MTIDSNKKADVLLVALQERYASLHKIRDRVQSTGIWALGLLLGAGGWLLQSGLILTCLQKILAIVGIGAGFIVLRFWYLADLGNGFAGQQKAMVRLEKALGFFAHGAFDTSDESIYPEKWQHVGDKGCEGRFFSTTYALLYVGVAFLEIGRAHV